MACCHRREAGSCFSAEAELGFLEQATARARRLIARGLRCHSLLRCCACLRCPWEITWPVGADLLFERVRSQRYMALTCVLNLYEWFSDYLMATRAELGGRAYYGGYHLQALFYRDCAGSLGESAWSGLQCDHRPFGGPWWELLLWVFPLLVVNNALNFVNNPFRSRWWALAALAQIVPSIARYLQLLLETPVAVIENQAAFPSSLHVVLAVWREGILLAGIAGPLLSWLVVLALLVRLMVFRAAFLEAWHAGAVKHTQELLGRPARKHFGPGSPARFQELAASLRGTCRPEELPACALAAMREEEEQLRSSGLLPAPAPPSPRKTSSSRLSWLSKMVPHRSTTQQRLAGLVRGSVFPGSTEQLDEEEDGEGPSDAKKTQQRLPGLVYVASLLSFVVVILFSNALFVGILEMHAACFRWTTQARGVARQGAEAAERFGDASSQLHELWQRVVAQQRLLEQAKGELMEMQASLAALPPIIERYDNATAGRVEHIVHRAQSAAAVLVFNSSELEAKVFGQVAAATNQSAASVRRLHEWVDSTSVIVMDVAASACVASLVAGFLAVFAVLALNIWVCRAWRRTRDDVASGSIKGSKRWQPDIFHPVRAPMLPGIMASSAIFGFLWLFVLVFVGMQVYWVARVSVHWKTAQRVVLNSVLLMGFRVVVLDGLLGRVLLSENGFVVRWCGFSWYICFALPFHFITSIAMAFSRFVMLAAVAIVYVVRVDTTLLPASLQMLDPGYVSFMASVLLAHRHQNPVWQCFLDAFMQQAGHVTSSDGEAFSWTKSLQRSKAALDLCELKCSRHNRARLRWSLLRTLTNNPQLALERRRGSNRASRYSRGSSRPSTSSWTDAAGRPTNLLPTRAGSFVSVLPGEDRRLSQASQLSSISDELYHKAFKLAQVVEDSPSTAEDDWDRPTEDGDFGDTAVACPERVELGCGLAGCSQASGCFWMWSMFQGV